MITFITIVHVIVSLLLIIIVLLQHGKGADMGATFGGSSQTVFGTGGAATFLSKVTIAVVVMFMVTSISLAFLSSRRSSESLLKDDRPTGAGIMSEEATEPPVEESKPAEQPTP